MTTDKNFFGRRRPMKPVFWQSLAAVVAMGLMVHPVCAATDADTVYIVGTVASYYELRMAPHGNTPEDRVPILPLSQDNTTGNLTGSTQIYVSTNSESSLSVSVPRTITLYNEHNNSAALSCVVGLADISAADDANYGSANNGRTLFYRGYSGVDIYEMSLDFTVRHEEWMAKRAGDKYLGYAEITVSSVP